MVPKLSMRFVKGVSLGWGEPVAAEFGFVLEADPANAGIVSLSFLHRDKASRPAISSLRWK